MRVFFLHKSSQFEAAISGGVGLDELSALRIPCHILCQISFHAAATNWRRRCREFSVTSWTGPDSVTVWSLMSRCWNNEKDGIGCDCYRCKVILQRSRGCVCMLGVYVWEWATEWLSGMESERSSVSNLKKKWQERTNKTLFQCRYSTPVSHLVFWLHSAMLACGWCDVGKGVTYTNPNLMIGCASRITSGLHRAWHKVVHRYIVNVELKISK